MTEFNGIFCLRPYGLMAFLRIGLNSLKYALLLCRKKYLLMVRKKIILNNYWLYQWFSYFNCLQIIQSIANKLDSIIVVFSGLNKGSRECILSIKEYSIYLKEWVGWEEEIILLLILPS